MPINRELKHDIEIIFYFTALASQRRIKNRTAKTHENKSTINPAFHPK